MTLVKFLLARIAEDEAAALAIYDHDHWAVDEDGNGDEWVTQVDRTDQRWRVAMVSRADVGDHIARHDPARVLAECEAKRRIVALHYVGDPDEWSPDHWACRLCQWDEDCDSPKQGHQHGAGRFPCDTLRLLALPYADHPDYREEWRP